MIKDCHGVPLPVFADGKVVSVSVVEGANPSGSVKNIKICLPAENQLPLAGQFYMLHAKRSDVLLPRPISVYHSEKRADGCVEIQFLILLKGKGTVELTSLRPDDQVSLLGPCGNRFEVAANSRVCIVGGGIGVAPVAGLAESLPAASYDFFASFKSGSYALDYIKPANLTITTDDGSLGEKGFVTGVLERLMNEEKIDYAIAVGPMPMMRAVAELTRDKGIYTEASMNPIMVDGTGMCGACRVTVGGEVKFACVDGPDFDAHKIDFDEVINRTKIYKDQERKRDENCNLLRQSV